MVATVADQPVETLAEIERKTTDFLTAGADLVNPNFAQMAEAIGIKGVRIEDPGEIEGKLREALAHPGPVLVDAVVNRREMAMPPRITAEMAKGFTLYTMKAIMSGCGDEIVNSPARTYDAKASFADGTPCARKASRRISFSLPVKGRAFAMVIRHLHYLSTLARERHFARAAAVCNVTQSTLSAGIKQLEESLGVLIVERGQRYVGLTDEGDRVLAWAQRVLTDYSGLQQELSKMRGGMVGQLRIGAIPVTLPIVSLLTGPFARHHARTDIVVTSETSIEIQRHLDEFGLDVGVTYLDNEPLARVRTLPLYHERYMLVTRADEPFSGRVDVGWAEAASLPLCLLTPDMQNRRILDMHFHEAGVEVHASVETNSLVTLWSHLRFGHWSTVVPHTFLLLLAEMDDLTAVPLVEPAASHLIGLVASDRDPLPPVARALLGVARGLDLATSIDREIARRYRGFGDRDSRSGNP